MTEINHLIIIPGLGGSNKALEILANIWNKPNFKTHIFDMRWRDKNSNLTSMDEKLTSLIRKLHLTGSVCIMGTSAGASAAYNSYVNNKSHVYKIVLVCGRLRRGRNVVPSLDTASMTSSTFKQSVIKCEMNQQLLSRVEKNKILTISSNYDPVVPASTMTINGVTDIKIPSLGHTLSIILALTIYFNQVLNFLEK